MKESYVKRRIGNSLKVFHLLSAEQLKMFIIQFEWKRVIGHCIAGVFFILYCQKFKAVPSLSCTVSSECDGSTQRKHVSNQHS